MLKTPLCDTLGIELPIFNAGMGGGIASAELAAAVSNSGGLGVLGMGGLPARVIRKEVRRLRTLTSRPFAVNVILALQGAEEVSACLEEQAPVVVLFWGDPTPYVREAHRGGTKIVLQCGSVDEARAGAAAGVDAIMIQGVEAGGHVRGTTALSIALPAVVEAVKPLPVISAGGVADGRGLAAVLSAGAQAASIGTRFLCSNESAAHPEYKARVVRARAEDTMHTGMFEIGWDAPHRILRNQAVLDWERAGCPKPGTGRPGEGEIVGRMPFGDQVITLERYNMLMPLAGFEGDFDYACLYAGHTCSLVNDIRPAAEIVAELARGAEAALRAAPRAA